MKISDQIKLAGIVPVVVIEDVKHAVPTAKALLDGGLNVMEITLRTAAGLESIKSVSEVYPEMLVGAGTVLTLHQCKACVNAGAKFIVSPGFDRQLVEWCVQNEVAVFPGCVTPTEITEALSVGLDVVKFFPANVYGGLSAMKALAAPFGNVKFIPTGGVDAENLGEYIGAPFIQAVGGSWLCTKADISAENFEKITKLTRDAVSILMGFEITHIGINMENGEAAETVAKQFSNTFAFEYKPGNSSIFAGKGIEVNRQKGPGEKGHIAISTNSLERAAAYLNKNGIHIDLTTSKFKDGKPIALYLTENFGGFAVHLVKK